MSVPRANQDRRNTETVSSDISAMKATERSEAGSNEPVTIVQTKDPTVATLRNAPETTEKTEVSGRRSLLFWIGVLGFASEVFLLALFAFSDESLYWLTAQITYAAEAINGGINSSILRIGGITVLLVCRFGHWVKAIAETEDEE